MMKEFRVAALILACLLGLCAGCVKRAAVNAAPANGEIYLSMSGGQWRPPGEVSYSRGIRSPSRREKKLDAPQKFTVIKLKDDTGRTVGKRVVPVFYGEVLIQALEQKLCALGYTVKVVPRIPSNGSGVEISRVAAEMEQNSGLFTLQGKCKLQARMEIWKNGTRIGGRDYQAQVADYAATGQDRLHVKLMEQASEEIIADSLPRISKATSDN